MWAPTAVIKDSEMGRLPWITQVGFQYTHKGPHKRTTRRSEEELDVTTEASVWKIQARAAHQPRNAGGPRKPEKAREQIILESLQNESTLLTPFVH